jgi:TolB-like protein
MNRSIVNTLAFSVLLMLSFTGCNKEGSLEAPLKIGYQERVSLNLNTTISGTTIDIAEQLRINNRFNVVKDKGPIVITTFVDLDDFYKTTHLGRVLSESMFNELFIRGFNVADFRGQSAVSINEDGEFYITRNSSKLKDEVENTYVLVGTYTKIDDNILINVRIMDNITGKIIASARSVYQTNYCDMDKGGCPKPKVEPIKIKRKIKIAKS